MAGLLEISKAGDGPFNTTFPFTLLPRPQVRTKTLRTKMLFFELVVPRGVSGSGRCLTELQGLQHQDGSAL